LTITGLYLVLKSKVEEKEIGEVDWADEARLDIPS
jgi:hypothetical protein